jgi:MoaA/NifB/PqqE/SkfB family radical SAM enzyme
MNPLIIAKSARNALSTLEINVNRLFGREFIPSLPDMLSIETSSLCNLKCRFCAYTKKQSPKVSMKDAFFIDCIEQALDMGYRRFGMTPCTGDVFMDRHLFDKLDFLERHPDVTGYQFFTNFTVPDADDVKRLVRLEKLGHLTISVYGHDLATFIAITKSTEKVYRRLLANLETLYERLDDKKFGLDFGLRSTRELPRQPVSDLLKLLTRFERAGVPVHKSRGLYNNWGGYITNDDVRGLAIDITGTDAIYKNGACAHLFTTVQIMANGIVNGCACRDVDATLRIGDLNEQKLRDILSVDNAAYMGLIDEQQRGEFRPVCESCDYYKSIYHMRSIYRKSAIPLQSLREFKARLGSAERAS